VVRVACGTACEVQPPDLDYTLGALVTGRLLVYLVYALIRPKRFSKGIIPWTMNGWIQSALSRVIVIAHHQAARRLYDAVFGGEWTFLSP